MTDPVMLLSQVHGEGRITFRALKEAGYDTLESVARAEVHVLADQARLSAVTALRLKSGAQHMMGRAPVDGASRPAAPGAAERAHREDEPGLADGPAGLPLSEGVLAEEALLLDQPSRRSDPAVESAARAGVFTEHPVEREPGDLHRGGRPVRGGASESPRIPDISAAVHAAAALPHASDPAPRTTDTLGLMNQPERRSFWSFGGPIPRSS